MKNSKAQNDKTNRLKSIKENQSVLGIDIKAKNGCANARKQTLNQYDDQFDSK